MTETAGGGGGETGASPSGWTIDTALAALALLRGSDERFEDERDRRYSEVKALEVLLFEERDRRYTEVGVEREKALKIKETADLAALGLAREIQTYKDEQANELRSQIEQERGNYVSRNDLSGAVGKIDARLEPITAYVQATQGTVKGSTSTVNWIIAGLGVVFAVASFLFGLIGLGISIYLLTQ